MPGRPWRLRPSRTRFVTSPRIGYASRPNGQLTAEVSHLLDLQPCWLLLGLAPTGKRRLSTAHARFGLLHRSNDPPNRRWRAARLGPGAPPSWINWHRGYYRLRRAVVE